MSDLPKRLFWCSVALAALWCAIGSLSGGVPDRVVDVLEEIMKSSHDLPIKSSSNFAFVAPNLSGMRRSNRADRQLINEMAATIATLQEHSARMDEELKAAQKANATGQELGALRQQVADQQVQLKNDREEVEELKKDLEREENKKYRPMPILVSAVFCAAGLVIFFLKNTDAEAKKWALGMLGVVAGFWLGGA